MSQPLRILVVDDEPLTRISLADYLQEEGYIALSAANGESAIQIQQAAPCHVCIVDVRMPGIDGVETIFILNTIAPGARYIIYTGSPQFSLTPALEVLGLDEEWVVRKPVADMQIFIHLIEKLRKAVAPE